MYAATYTAFNDELEKIAKKDEASSTKALIGLPLAGAAGGAALYGLAGLGRAGAAPIGTRLLRGAGVGGAVGIATAGLIGLGKLLNKADPSGKTIETAAKLAPSLLAAYGAIKDTGKDKYSFDVAHAAAREGIELAKKLKARNVIPRSGNTLRDYMHHMDLSAHPKFMQGVKTKAASLDAIKEKVSFDWHKFREGVSDEGVPLAGATLGAAIGGKYGKGLTGAALGYAAGGGASLLRSKLKGEAPSDSRKMLAGGALGYGLGGLAHAGLGSTVFKKGLAQGVRGAGSRALHTEGRLLHGALEEGLPALGATLGTGTAMGMGKKSKQSKIKTSSLTDGALSLFKEAGLFSSVKPVAKAAFKPSFAGHSKALGIGTNVAKSGVETVKTFNPLTQTFSKSKSISIPGL